jgi:hypothetical protein
MPTVCCVNEIAVLGYVGGFLVNGRHEIVGQLLRGAKVNVARVQAAKAVKANPNDVSGVGVGDERALLFRTGQSSQHPIGLENGPHDGPGLLLGRAAGQNAHHQLVADL